MLQPGNRCILHSGEYDLSTAGTSGFETEASRFLPISSAPSPGSKPHSVCGQSSNPPLQTHFPSGRTIGYDVGP